MFEQETLERSESRINDVLFALGNPGEMALIAFAFEGTELEMGIVNVQALKPDMPTGILGVVDNALALSRQMRQQITGIAMAAHARADKNHGEIWGCFASTSSLECAAAGLLPCLNEDGILEWAKFPISPEESETGLNIDKLKGCVTDMWVYLAQEGACEIDFELEDAQEAS